MPRTPTAHDQRRQLTIVGAPTHGSAPGEAIARRAYELFLARGASHGRDLDDWLEAERQVEASSRQVALPSSPRGISEKDGPLLPQTDRVPQVTADAIDDVSDKVVATQDHDVIRVWAARRGAEPATGEATGSGPAIVDVRDGGAGIRFNFPGAGPFRRITWEEWFGHFDHHGLMMVYDGETSGRADSNRYRLVRADDWSGRIDSRR
jgi:hypothetical protein